MSVYLILSLWLSSKKVSAVCSTYHKDLAEAGMRAMQIVEFRGVRGPPQTPEEYGPSNGMTPAEAVEKFAATGLLKCGGYQESANLVVKNDVIFTANHIFRDYKTCKKLRKPEGCTFQVRGKKPVRIARQISSGDICPEKTEIFFPDWTLLKLAEPIEGVKPYKLKTRGPDERFNEKDVVTVGAMSADFTREDPKTHKRTYPKRVQNCSIAMVSYVSRPVTIESNCGGSLGKSGGAILDPDLTEPTIIGMTVGSPLMDKAIEEKEVQTGKPVVMDLIPGTISDGGLAIYGGLEQQIRAATK